ncbi:V-type ATP synthase subunit A [Synergistes jonesii]|uniref:V-type ATP synthase alpha chain n=2 Tax=Synergistes jonesii TaxID=2754 RepID=A0A073IUS3_9BACT|nr:V-type ATP synthase subunit A [Synergistes jonesii]KEJ93509.1 ATP synthase subunit A [Synergistes jonesii]MDY2985161.1 V-type ATP synthase subunit A [Synergistes jonesii]OFB61427.1 ATP synthase subunit A [Synergistes jonesii]OFB65295.1 ATP synthase subunit A [Synergistes jonesii]OFB68645.1 ATP synthase subunit A [Synergistes jonesii]
MELKNNSQAPHRGTVEFVNGPVIRASGMREFAMREVVKVGPKRLMGEIIKMDGDEATIQVYEDTDGLRVYEEVVGTGEPLSVELGPGLIGSFFDGIGRPLDSLLEREGMYISPGTSVNMINRERLWEITPVAKTGDLVTGGVVLAEAQETPLLVHKIMTPPGFEGEITWIIPAGRHHAGGDVAKVKDAFGREVSIPIIQRWPVRTPRPYRERLLPNEPFVTGQRVIDGLFPLAKGGTACIPGGFGTGKTVTQHQLAKWGDAQVVIYIGCGERGNEMTDVLEQFPVLEDPRSGRPLMERTILIANTSNMPVAAREASIYTGITLAEYFRDMGYDVAIMADSTSRWAEALRELSGRLEEIPAEEGFPAYLPSRLAEFYERAGRVVTISGENGSVSVIGAVSPPGGDFTEPVTRHTKRFIRCFWGLDKNLANARHYPAISWTDSYSEYAGELDEWFCTNVDPRWGEVRGEVRNILAEDNKIQQVIKLVGEDVLPDDQRLIAFTAFLIKNGYLQQNSFGSDSYSPPLKGFEILSVILEFHHKAMELVRKDIPISLIKDDESVDAITHLRELAADDRAGFDNLRGRIDTHLKRVAAERTRKIRGGE